MGGFAAPSKGAQFDYIASVDALGTGVSAATLTANVAYLALVKVGKPLTVSTISLYVGTASGNVDVGLYSYDGTTWTRIASSGSTANAGSSAIQAVALTAAVTLVPGVNYYLALAADNATATIGKVSITGTLGGAGKRGVSKGTSFPLPTTITAAGASAICPWLMGA